MQPKKLENYRFFQPIAWTLCVGFASFVGMLSLQLQDTVAELESSSVNFETRLQNIEQAVGIKTDGPN